ncbi:hypothetical protein Rhal01_03418 [Rubritalea halochordaticola]|uniref:Uncharacterized protein n=1 Tax=Rubritalea halochordaticola TaxID=714537 RepID=A0ABP9V5G6_9BACT
MRYTFIDNAYRVVRITGPTHNLLGLEFRDDGQDCVQTAVDLRNGGQSVINQDELIRHVNQGVSDANRDFGANYFAMTIQYAGDDTPPEDIYSVLAYKIIERLVTSESFASK